jgi:hypothetical protein
MSTLRRPRTTTLPSLLWLLPLTTIVAITAAGCEDDAATGPSAEIRKFCQDLVASPAFACCSGEDKASAHFAARYKYQNADDCAVRLAQQGDSSQGRQSFDSEAAASCLSHLSSRSCGLIPNAKSREDEEKAGCARVLKGKQEENQPCTTNDDCKAGLLCPPSPDTGVSSCAKPAASNQACPGVTTGLVDHPPCEANLVCALTGENPVCPSPPCLVFQCVPVGEENDACTGLECGAGLSCKEGVCAKGGLAPAGAGCKINDHCQPGLFCDPPSGKCTARKEAGAECRSGANAFFECKGVCKNVGDGPGTCASFCGE